MAPKWAAPDCTMTDAPDIFAASHTEWLTGEKTSFSPCHTRTGADTEARLNPQRARKARVSSTQPYADACSASA